MFSALIYNGKNSVFMDLPRDRFDIAGKLYSIGIEQMPDGVVLTDNEGDAVRVQLSADNDFGNHLIKLFNKDHNLNDVNKAAYKVQSSPEEFGDTLEQNLLYDQYGSLKELLDDIWEMTYEAGQYCETFYFSLDGQLDNDDYEPYEIDNSVLLDYKSDIEELVAQEQDSMDMNMKDFFYDDDNAQTKMVTARWGITEKNKVLYGKVDFRLREPFTAEEKEKVRDWVLGQNFNGFGECLEQRPIETEDGKVSGIKFTITGPNSYKKTVKTDSSDNFNLTDLVPGTYTVTENKNSRYETQKAQTVKIESGKTATVSFKNVLKKSEFRIVKKDAETKKVVEIAGFKFKIKDSDGKYIKVDGTDTFETDDEGVVSFETRLPDGKYQLIEIAAGEGYLLDGKPKEFEVTSTSTEVEIEKFNLAEKGTITITKKGDAFTSVTDSEENGVKIYQPVYDFSNLEGAEFEIIAAEDIDTGDGTIRAKKGEVVDTVTTEENGKAVSKELYLGTYLVKESKTPDGYIFDGKEYEVAIKYAGETVPVTNADITIQNTRQKVEVSLTKILETDEQYGIGNNDELSEVSFGLYANEDLTAEDGKKIPDDGLIEIISVTEDGTATFTTDIPTGDYYVKEYSANSKYVLDDTHYEFTFDATADSEVQ